MFSARWAEGGNFILPNSELAAHYANGFHAYSKQQYPERPIFVNFEVDSIVPEVEIEPSWTAYIEGKDVVFDAIIKRLTR